MKRICTQGIAALLISGCLFSSCAMAETDTSIFVATDRHASYQTEAVEGNPKSIPVVDENGNWIWSNNLIDVLQQVAKDEQAIQPSVVLLGGDNVGSGSDDATDGEGNPIGQPVFSLDEVKEEIHSVFGDEVSTYFTYGSHDCHETGAYTDSFLSGPVKCDGYYLYGISYSQMIYGTDEQAIADEYEGKDLDDPNGISAETASRHFTEWVDHLEDHLPIIFMSHVPMHANRADNLGAMIWIQALNHAGESHDLIVLWGHNHSSEDRKATRKVEQKVYLVPRKEKMSIQTWKTDEKGKLVYRQKNNKLMVDKPDLNFTYMNAGYITLGYGTLLTFRDMDDDGAWDELIAQRYTIHDESGKDAVFGLTEIPSPCTIELRAWE